MALLFSFKSALRRSSRDNALLDPRGNVARYWNDSPMSTGKRGIRGWFLALSDPILARRRASKGTISRMTPAPDRKDTLARSEEHTSELQSLMRLSSATFDL